MFSPNFLDCPKTEIPKLAPVIDSLISQSCFYRTPRPKKYPTVPFIVWLGSNSKEKYVLWKRKPQAPKSITFTKTHDTKLSLTTWLHCYFTISQKYRLTLISVEFSGQHQWGNLLQEPSLSILSGERQGNLHDKPLCAPFSPKANILSERNPFLLVTASLTHPSSYSHLPLCTAPWSTLPEAVQNTAPFMNHLIRPMRTSYVLSWILFFNSPVA